MVIVSWAEFRGFSTIFLGKCYSFDGHPTNNDHWVAVEASAQAVAMQRFSSTLSSAGVIAVEASARGGHY